MNISQAKVPISIAIHEPNRKFAEASPPPPLMRHNAINRCKALYFLAQIVIDVAGGDGPITMD